jgi:hypothetical protein
MRECAWTDASQLVRIPEEALAKKSTPEAFEERPEQPQDAAAEAARQPARPPPTASTWNLKSSGTVTFRRPTRGCIDINDTLNPARKGDCFTFEPGRNWAAWDVPGASLPPRLEEEGKTAICVTSGFITSTPDKCYWAVARPEDVNPEKLKSAGTVIFKRGEYGCDYIEDANRFHLAGASAGALRGHCEFFNAGREWAVWDVPGASPPSWLKERRAICVTSTITRAPPKSCLWAVVRSEDMRLIPSP